MDEPTTPPPARDPKTGRILPGHSGNPGGRNKLVEKAMRRLRKGSVAAADYLNRVVAGEETTWAMTKEGPVSMPCPAKDRIAAALGVLKLALPKTQPKDPLDDADPALRELARAALHRLAGLDS